MLAAKVDRDFLRLQPTLPEETCELRGQYGVAAVLRAECVLMTQTTGDAATTDSGIRV